MTEILELVSPPAIHADDNPDCPFCPIEPPEGFTTHPGEANDSKKLAAVMEKPDTLTSQQGGARPKDGGPRRQSPATPQPQPTPIFSDAQHGAYSCEAHHAISGNQAMKGHPIEEWISAEKGKIKKDTGYSINNSDNGVWLPSVPEKYKGGGWGTLKYNDKLTIARRPMEAGKGQFHKGPHDITDPEDPFGVYHKSYMDELKRLLTDLHRLIRGWADHCAKCEKIDREKGPFDPNWRVNGMLDNLSIAVAAELKMPAPAWSYFISRVAMDYHKTVCPHLTL